MQKMWSKLLRFKIRFICYLWSYRIVNNEKNYSNFQIKNGGNCIRYRLELNKLNERFFDKKCKFYIEIKKYIFNKVKLAPRNEKAIYFKNKNKEFDTVL